MNDKEKLEMQYYKKQKTQAENAIHKVQRENNELKRILSGKESEITGLLNKSRKLENLKENFEEVVKYEIERKKSEMNFFQKIKFLFNIK